MKVILREDVADLGVAGQTIEVKAGYGRNYLIPRNLAILGSFLPSVAFWVLYGLGAFESTLNQGFLFLFVTTLFLQVWTGVLYYKYPSGPKAYFSLVTNFRACTGGQVMLIALFNPELALYLYVAAYVFIGFLFGLHGDRRS